ncbi:DHH family phosphoesterase [Candidatus Pacearchaeota archaeon]|nr:MAG: DHH family phosphoesterase [Candidatus Pacearchaeota archaeon]
MLSEKDLNEVREHLARAQNPLFYYDNDVDGLCSFVLLRRMIGRGKGVAVRSFPDLNASYARKVTELNADYVFVLDKPIISTEFLDEISKLGVPLVWIDHHDLSYDSKRGGLHTIYPSEVVQRYDNVFVYNPVFGTPKSFEPVTYWAYKVVNNKSEVWLAVIGCIGDHFLPDFIDEFAQRYPEFWSSKKITLPFEALYTTEIGRITQALGFGLKDSVTNVIKLQNFLITCSSPRDVLSELPTNYYFRKRYNFVKRKYDELLRRAKSFADERMVFFVYAGNLSISADLANELSYHYPGKYIVVAYRKGDVANLSLRGSNVRDLLAKVLKKVEGTGGGHRDAVGARINASNLQKFKRELWRAIENAQGK